MYVCDDEDVFVLFFLGLWALSLCLSRLVSLSLSTQTRDRWIRLLQLVIVDLLLVFLLPLFVYREALLAVSRRLHVTQGAPSLCRLLKERGVCICLISGGFSFFANELQKQLGIDFIAANELEFDTEGNWALYIHL